MKWKYASRVKQNQNLMVTLVKNQNLDYQMKFSLLV